MGGLARKYKDKLRPEFIDENILTARVQALRILTRTDDKKWPEYIKYNIELIERYGTDTTNSYVDATVINNFVFNGIFLHGNDPEHYEKGLRWMEGVIRRNPKEANHIDTYANLLYKAGNNTEAIEWQTKAVELAKETQSIFLENLEKNLEKMKKGEPTWTE